MRVFTKQEMLYQNMPLDEYLVKFNIQKSDGFWTKQVESYYAKGKAAHESVEDRWNEDYKDCVAEIISIIYV